MNATRCYDEFYLVWESSCRNFIEDVKFASEVAKASRLKLHVFLRKDTPVKALPPRDSDWIENHFSLTTSPYASDTGLIAHLLGKYGDFAELDDENISRTRVYLVAERERQYEELISILKLFCPDLDIQEINGIETDILEVVEDSCRFCRLIFANHQETEEHNTEEHDYFCENPSCNHYHQRFESEEALSKHKTSQTTCLSCDDLFCSEEVKKAHMKSEHNSNDEKSKTEARVTLSKDIGLAQSALRISCQFCPHKEFFTQDQKEIHMKNSHKKCNCSCGKYFRTREEYLIHFYSVYPLPCYENRKCPHRFQSVYYQAAHHREFHNSLTPFYCIPCQKRKTEEKIAQTTKTSFKDDRSLRIHGCSLGHNENEMFLFDFDADQTSLNVRAETSLQKKSPSRTCSNLNYC